MFLPDVKISLNGEEKNTDEQGRAIFKVETGTHEWIASKDGYKKIGNSIHVTKDVDMPIFMESVEMDTLNIIVKKYVNEDIGKRTVISKYYRLFAGRHCLEVDFIRELNFWSEEVNIKQYTLHFINDLSEVFG